MNLELPSSLKEQADDGALAVIVQDMVNESGRPIGFDARTWIESWVRSPAPAFGNRCPIEFLDSEEGIARVRAVVRSMQAGSYW